MVIRSEQAFTGNWVEFFAVGFADDMPSMRRNSFAAGATLFRTEAEAAKHQEGTILSLRSFFVRDQGALDTLLANHKEMVFRHCEQIKEVLA